LSNDPISAALNDWELRNDAQEEREDVGKTEPDQDSKTGTHEYETRVQITTKQVESKGF
jgi:hypothetical protein